MSRPQNQIHDRPHRVLSASDRAEQPQVERRTLIDQIMASESRIILLQAPRGYGTTTLLSQLHASQQQAGGRSAWPTPDAEDFAASCCTGDDIATGLVCIDAPDGFSACQLDAVNDLARRLKDDGRLVIASHDHELPDRLTHPPHCIGPRSLRFSKPEIAHFLGGTGSFAPGVLESAEGWPLAVDAIRRAAQHADAPTLHDVIDEVPEISEFFRSHVLCTLSGETIAALTAAALIEAPFSIEFLAGITEDPFAWSRIEPAVTRGLFIAPLEGRVSSYRLHPLFAAFLRDHAVRSGLFDKQIIHARACRWFRRQRDWDNAIRHAALAGDGGQIVEIATVAGGWTMLCSGQVHGVKLALDALPADLLRADPQLRALRIVSSAKAGRGYPPRNGIDDDLLARFIDFYEDRLTDPIWMERLRGLRDDLPPSDHMGYAVLSSMICLKHLDAGALDACDTEARHAIDALLQADMPSATVYLHTYRARAQIIRGNLDLAERHICRAVAIVREPIAELAQLERLVSVHAAGIALERGDIAKGRRLMAQGWPFLSSLDGWYDALAEAIATSVRLAVAAGDLAKARRVLENGDIVGRRRALPRLQMVIAGWHMVVAATAGDAGAVLAAHAELENLILRYRDLFALDSYYLAEALGYARAYHALFLRDGDTAHKLMVAQAARAETIGAIPLMRRSLLVAAQGAHISGDGKAAACLLNRALAGMADIDMLMASLLTPRDTMQKLVGHALKRGLLPDAHAKVIATAFTTPGGGEENSSLWLSKREEQVLHLVGIGMTTKEIARELRISDSTVKFHRKGIYMKLGVNRRSRALEILHTHRARQPGIAAQATP